MLTDQLHELDCSNLCGSIWAHTHKICPFLLVTLNLVTLTWDRIITWIVHLSMSFIFPLKKVCLCSPKRWILPCLGWMLCSIRMVALCTYYQGEKQSFLRTQNVTVSFSYSCHPKFCSTWYLLPWILFFVFFSCMYIPQQKGHSIFTLKGKFYFSLLDPIPLAT